MADADHTETQIPNRAWDNDAGEWVYYVDFEEAAAKAVRLAQLLYGDPEYTYYKQYVRWSPKQKTHIVPIAPNGHETITREEW